MSQYQSIFDDLNRDLEDRLRRYQKEVKIDVSSQVTGQLPNLNLAPINLSTPDLTLGTVPLGKGGTGADLSGSLAGVFQILNDGDPSAVVAALDSGLIDWNNHPGSPAIGEALIYTGIGLGADFGQYSAGALTGTLAVNHGGTGIVSYTVGDILYASGTTALSTLAGVATGNALISGGVSTAPSWGKIGLTTHVSGTLSPTNGGTGVNNGSFNLTVPASGTAALIGLAQTFTVNQTIAADLAFSGNGRRITGEFSTATLTNRLSFVTSVTNDVTVVQTLPNGTGTTSGFAAYNSSDPANAGRIVLTCTPTAANFNANFSGTASAVPLNILISGVQAASFGTDQSLALSQWLQMTEITAPAAGAANTGRLFLRDNGAGKTQLCIIFNTGAIQVIATQP